MRRGRRNSRLSSCSNTNRGCYFGSGCSLQIIITINMIIIIIEVIFIINIIQSTFFDIFCPRHWYILNIVKIYINGKSF